ncbi:leucine-rich repeat domain-containing protein, partial [Candidatus Poribacteria bacterium]|nr:leucine-rich repeat domain-containing protein [Candidatus Poribacteria bacterium]
MKRKFFVFGIIFLISFCMIVDIAHAQEPRPIIRIIYFLPSDAKPQEDINKEVDRLIRDSQQFFADEIERHGFGRKTFLFEQDNNGNAVVHHTNGKHSIAHYQNTNEKFDLIHAEIKEAFNTSRDYYVVLPEYNLEEFRNSRIWFSSVRSDGGVSISGENERDVSLPYQLGNSFGLNNADFNFQNGITLTYCGAEWLEVHRAFNVDQHIAVEQTSIQMLPIEFVSSPNTFRLRFELNDADGLHQIQLFRANESKFTHLLTEKFIACKGLNGKNITFELLTSELTHQTFYLRVRIIDITGEITQSYIETDIWSILPPAQPISMPDVNLSAAVREALNIGSSFPITTYDILELQNLTADEKQISDITGLQYAIELDSLSLSNNAISDLTALSELTRLTTLSLSQNNIIDISPLVDITGMKRIFLGRNQISNISALSKMTQLTTLTVDSNQISDISALSNMTQLTRLWLSDNDISDISALSNMTQLTELWL